MHHFFNTVIGGYMSIGTVAKGTNRYIFGIGTGGSGGSLDGWWNSRGDVYFAPYKTESPSLYGRRKGKEGISSVQQFFRISASPEITTPEQTQGAWRPCASAPGASAESP